MNAWFRLIVIVSAALNATPSRADKGEVSPALSREHQAMFCGNADTDPGLAYSRAVSAELDRRLSQGAKSTSEALRAMNQRYCGSASPAREVTK